uniref:Uncharacterized protein n=1 Tax=Romanomermis culicivorax TaxID=13658 RepID=A0A915IQP2_ROMCU
MFIVAASLFYLFGIKYSIFCQTRRRDLRCVRISRMYQYTECIL